VSKIYKALARAESERDHKVTGTGTSTPPEILKPAGAPPAPTDVARPAVETPAPAEILRPVAEAPTPSEIVRSRRAAPPLAHRHVDIPEHREEYEKLKVMLTLEASRSDLKSVMLVSALRGEGVSTVTLGLAATMAEAARQGILVVDLNSANPDLADRLGLEAPIGLGEMLAKDAGRSEAILESPVPHLFLLGRGTASADLSQPSSLALFEELVRGLRTGFDHLLFDGGALQSSPDSLLVASKVDGVILVVQAERTGSQEVREATEQLRMAGANVLGIVLNRRREYLPSFLARRL
jgi:Mrp family chromosome partitioning ATPase